jgi:hypothetical protein
MSVTYEFIDMEGRERSAGGLEALVSAIHRGEITRDSLMRLAGAARWTRAAEHEHFRAIEALLASTGGAVSGGPSAERAQEPLPSPAQEAAPPSIDLPGAGLTTTVEPNRPAAPENDAPEECPGLAAEAVEDKPYDTGLPDIGRSALEVTRMRMRWIDFWIGLLLIGAVAPIALYIANLVYFQKLIGLVRAYGWGRVPVSLIPNETMLVSLATFFEPAGHILAGVAFVGAIIVFRWVAEDLWISGFRLSLKWTVITLFVPLLNLIRPWLGFAEIRRAILFSGRHTRVGVAWVEASGTSLFTILLSVTYLLITASRKVMADDLPPTLPVTEPGFYSFIGAYMGTMWMVLAMDVVLLCVMVVYLWTMRSALHRLFGAYRARLGAEVTSLVS